MENAKKKTNKGVSIKTVGWLLGGFGVAIVVMLVVSLYMLSFQFEKVQKTTKEYVSLKISALEVQTSSDYLTEQARSFVVTADDEFIFNYMNEGYFLNNREKSLDALTAKIGNAQPYSELVQAVNRSKQLMNNEFYAMRLTIEAFNKTNDYNDSDHYENDKKFCEKIRTEVLGLDLKEGDGALTVEEKKAKALDLVYGNSYNFQKKSISKEIDESIKGIDKLLEDNILKSSEQLRAVMIVQQAFIVVLILFFATAIVLIRFGLTKPIDVAVKKINKREFLESRGLREYRYLVDAYNEARAASISNTEKLQYIAEHDTLTGVYNRAGYDAFYHDLNLDKTIYILIDVDNFKDINDNFGHMTGDKALRKLSDILSKYFPHDHICRIGGDEFAILIFNFYDRESVKKELIDKFKKINKEASTKERGIPAMTISIGVAIGTNKDDTDTLYRKADKAMYEIKQKTKGSYCFYDDIKK